MNQMQSSYTEDLYKGNKMLPKPSLIIFYLLLGLWSTSQLLSVFAYLPDRVLSILHYSKNILGAAIVVWSLLVVASQFIQHRVISFDKNLFFFALLFPFYVTLSNIVRYEISWKEVLLYWLWVIGVYMVFPAILHGEQQRRKATIVIFWANILVIFIGISFGILKGRYYWLEHGNRMIFTFLHPNYYCNSWQVILTLSFLYAITATQKYFRNGAMLLILISLLFIILALSRNTIIFSILMILCYFLMSIKWSSGAKIAVIFFMLFCLLVSFLITEISVGKIDKIATGRLSIWKMTLESNFRRASALEYLFGFGKYKIEGYPEEMDKVEIKEDKLTRSHIDNAYLDIFLQSGIIGFLLFFIPLFKIARRTMVNSAAGSNDLLSKEVRIAFGCWVGLLGQIFTSSIVPSFGNVVDILILVFMAPNAFISLKRENNCD
jgi:hypothetical protein